MQDILLNQEIADVDFAKIAALQQKRTLAFVNHFLITTVQFLNTFAKTCEEKLMHFERKLEKINASMVLLEAKLSSIPEVNTLEVVSKTQENICEQSKEQTNENNVKENEKIVIEEQHEDKSDSIKIKPEYEKFIKMLQVGVPKEAVKLKLSMEGLDPSEFEKMLGK